MKICFFGQKNDSVNKQQKHELENESTFTKFVLCFENYHQPQCGFRRRVSFVFRYSHFQNCYSRFFFSHDYHLIQCVFPSGRSLLLWWPKKGVFGYAGYCGKYYSASGECRFSAKPEAWTCISKKHGFTFATRTATSGWKAMFLNCVARERRTVKYNLKN